MTLMVRLLHLYHVDAQLRGLRSRLDSAERYLGAQERLRTEVEQRRDELVTRRKHLQAAVANHEMEVKSIDERLEKLRDELNSSVTNKQYTAVLNELNNVKLQRGEVEDRIIEHMESIGSGGTIEMTVLREGKLMQLRAPMPDLDDIRELSKKKR